ncbi:hypothetical protein KMI_07g11870 [Encephalitozoon hellem]|uniref:Uncharacterized protein n=1 Tax=Encephalitozoon hellem TaxID=27973 RepID=A0A9Q9C590_ENCHE|nr:uncharacterized protein EHEL_030760 [Encephalitozoon hellem ATCC 50504]AFM97973.1 hypothetical protein EHEL_030760 [Encephalitozoon hellem ATCC 50504]KAG5859345.1 hypothetical protein KMI_07g11870 [Encephalitozoon hellem]UTX42777.1 hypothetical protein GPU96_03g04990 [Encephalitozoon hellem]WEL38236.1 hypothetical protein PFJ87_03g00940 [Encephalitozoon hellem]|eukprot:XP_003886954.1 hypothetical protein EHEL_030760 [Encephalitozoon hellem ATCC 50504]
MSLRDYALAVFEATGNSFAIGCSMAFASNMLKSGDRHFYSRQPLRSGGELAKHTMVYSLLYYGLSEARAVRWIRLLGPSFVASFICGMRNGRGFGIRSGIDGMVSSFVQEIVGKIKGC